MSDVYTTIRYERDGAIGTLSLARPRKRNAVTVANTGQEPLQHLFLLSLQNHAGSFIELERLAPGANATAGLARGNSSSPSLVS